MSPETISFYQITIYISIILCLVSCELDLLNKTDVQAVAAYAGSVVRLTCKGVAQQPFWTYAQSLHNLTFSPLEDKDTIVEERDALSIYNVGESETGVYRCRIGGSSRLVSLEVLDDEEYTVVKPQTSHGPYASPPSTLGKGGLIVFSEWTPWSECSTCGAVGRRRRYGMCHVRPANRNNASCGSSKLSKNDKKIFKDFPDGLPCRSMYLPESIRSLPEVKIRRNEIMIGLCKVICKKTRNDVDSFVSFPPGVVRDIVFTKAGQTVKLRCPGAIYRDAPYGWAAAGARVSPRALFQESAGRARVDARDRLVLSPSSHIDAGTYSCGAYEQVAGYVVLVVK